MVEEAGRIMSPTCALRLFRPRETDGLVIQQAWVDREGYVEWRELDIVEEQ
jgi:hypothetical protein